MHLRFLHSLFIWLLINICKVLSDHLLTSGKQENGFSSGISGSSFYMSEIYFS
jgi:hypothetical protein